MRCANGSGSRWVWGCAVELAASVHVNARYWDLIDLLLLRDLIEDLSPVREACIEVFDSRETHSWPPELLVPSS